MTIEKFNKIWSVVMTILAIAIAIGAICCNLAHLFTAGLVFLVGQSKWEKFLED